jgi:hypothetical protein
MGAEIGIARDHAHQQTLPRNIEAGLKVQTNLNMIPAPLPERVFRYQPPKDLLSTRPPASSRKP